MMDNEMKHIGPYFGARKAKIHLDISVSITIHIAHDLGRDLLQEARDEEEEAEKFLEKFPGLRYREKFYEVLRDEE